LAGATGSLQSAPPTGARQRQASAKSDQDNQRRCLAARRSLDSLQGGGARYRINDQGERDYLDDNQRQTELDSARQRVATYCR
jgi:hypothetical protein